MDHPIFTYFINEYWHTIAIVAGALLFFSIFIALWQLVKKLREWYRML